VPEPKQPGDGPTRRRYAMVAAARNRIVGSRRMQL